MVAAPGSGMGFSCGSVCPPSARHGQIFFRKKATYSKQNGKAQLLGVLLPFTISAITFFVSNSSYDKYLKDPSDQNYQIANNLNKASILLEGWGIFNYFKQIIKTAKIVNSNKLDREKLNKLIEEEKNIILKEKLILN